MYFELKSINVWTMIKTWFFLNFVIGLGLGVVYSMISLFTLTAATEFLVMQGLDPNMIDPFTMMLLMPIFFACGNAVFGTIFVAILSIVYNITRRLFGGLQFELVPDEDTEGDTDDYSSPADMTTAATVAAVASSPETSTRYDDSGYAPPPPPPPSPETAQAIRKASQSTTPPPESMRRREPEAPGPMEVAPIERVESAKPVGNDEVTEPMFRPKPDAPDEAETPTQTDAPTRAESPTPPPEREAPQSTESADKNVNREDSSETSDRDTRRND